MYLININIILIKNANVKVFVCSISIASVKSMDILARISSNIKIEIYSIYLILEKLPLGSYIQLDSTFELSG